MILSKPKIGALCGILCSMMYVLFTVLAMLVYPGGYNFFWDYMSTLGVTVTSAGVPSPLNYLLYATACTGAGVCMIPFWLVFRRVFPEPQRAMHTSLIGTITGVTAGPFLALAGLIPGNLWLEPHRWASIFFFLFYAFAILIYSYAILLNKDYEKRYAVIGIVVFIVCLLHVTVPALSWPNVQKVAVYGLLLWPLVQGTKLLQVLRTTPS